MKRTESFPTFCGRGLPSPQSDEFAFRATLLFVPITALRVECLHSVGAAITALALGAQAESFDVVVIGSGGAGLSAGIMAKEAGAKTVVLEKQAYLGGKTNFASGGMNAAGTK